ncbi:hypothetical protein [Halobaculum gomorrense]|uniref:Uncharacterized protein n=1 Tax=Halobaculum gomorrense TaxID=43928 RepID=A0A1M5SD93_9EURY|nr:hypothetical protein [Halobaculum gomorrense]SHH35893.1 hypothetical protein SAMN05443636_2407 [Halobaculum gomorrense]
MTDDTHTVDSPLEELGGMLVAYRMAIYLGGLAVIGFPLALRELAGVTLPESVRAALTVSVVSFMVATYVSELLVETDGGDGGGTGGDTGGSTSGSGDSAGYPLRTRVAVAAAVIGLAAGVYVALEMSVLGGLLFVGGSYLFAYLAYDRDGAAGGGPETDGGAQ